MVCDPVVTPGCRSSVWDSGHPLLCVERACRTPPEQAISASGRADADSLLVNLTLIADASALACSEDDALPAGFLIRASTEEDVDQIGALYFLSYPLGDARARFLWKTFRG